MNTEMVEQEQTKLELRPYQREIAATEIQNFSDSKKWLVSVRNGRVILSDLKHPKYLAHVAEKNTKRLAKNWLMTVPKRRDQIVKKFEQKFHELELRKAA